MTIDTMQRFEQTNALSQQENDYLLSPDNYNLLDSFPSHQQGGFRPSFYNPFEIKHRRRTSRAQLKILEKSFSENAKPNATTRRILAQTLDMTPRGVQIWFQNRRAKAKLQRRGYKEEDHHHHQTNNGIFSNQPSVLFSQFLANIQANDQSKKLAAHFHSTGGDTWPSWKPNGNAPVSDSIRTVATMAAAKAAGNASMPNFDSNLISCENNGENWRNGIHPLQSKPFTESNQYFDISMRRKSCPVPAASLDLASCHDDFSVQNTFMTPGWYHPMSSFQIKRQSDVTMPSPVSSVSNIKNQRPCDTQQSPMMMNQSSPIDYCTLQHDANSNQQLTPSLTASCSASTVAGSPVSLDNLYNDPVVVPMNNNYYNTNMPLPLSSQQLW